MAAATTDKSPSPWRNRSYGVALLLLAIVIFQNVEPTRIDVLFWSLPSVPKLVLLLVGMFLGAALWELGRRVFTR